MIYWIFSKRKRHMTGLKMHKIFLLLISAVLLLSCARDDRGLVVGKVQQASKLATTEFTIDKMIFGTQDKKLFWAIKLNEARIFAYSQVIVKTGINLKKMKMDDIVIKGSSIQITLPPIEVINFSYPTEKIRIDDRLSDTKKLFNEINIEQLEELLRKAELDVRNHLEDMGVVETTQDKTQALLTGLLQNLGYNEIHIGFKSDELIIDKVGAKVGQKQNSKNEESK
jgi:hypothetical protein